MFIASSPAQSPYSPPIEDPATPSSHGNRAIPHSSTALSQRAPTEGWSAQEGSGTQAHPASGLTVQECVGIGTANHPALAAYEASVRSARVSLRALCNTSKIAGLLAPDLKWRKQQAMKGLAAAQAQLSQARWDVIYDITRSYYTVVYARAQQRVADKVVENLQFSLDLVKDLVEVGANRELNENTVDELAVYVGIARTKRAEAEMGVLRALEALRQAMGVGPEFELAIPSQQLPVMDVSALTQEQVVAEALSRRGELVQAGLAADVFRLEICAQGAIRLRPLTRTFASGADIHSRPIPLPNRGTEYQPGAVSPEMPVSLYGDRDERMEKASALSDRADAVYETTRSLIRLEGANAYLRAVEAQKKVIAAREANDAAVRLSKRTRDAIELGEAREKILTKEVIAGQAQSAYNETLYQQILALTNLERVTAGGIRIPWPAPIPLPKEPKNALNGQGNGDPQSPSEGPLVK